jgi:hypothetical protein
MQGKQPGRDIVRKDCARSRIQHVRVGMGGPQFSRYCDGRSTVQFVLRRNHVPSPRIQVGYSDREDSPANDRTPVEIPMAARHGMAT